MGLCYNHVTKVLPGLESKSKTIMELMTSYIDSMNPTATRQVSTHVGHLVKFSDRLNNTLGYFDDDPFPKPGMTVDFFYKEYYNVPLLVNNQPLKEMLMAVSAEAAKRKLLVDLELVDISQSNYLAVCLRYTKTRGCFRFFFHI